MIVVATAKGYYGSKVREPGETFGLRSDADFSASWMQPVEGARDPLDHDGNGRKGGAKRKAAQVIETEIAPPADPAPAVDPVTGDEI